MKQNKKTFEFEYDGTKRNFELEISTYTKDEKSLYVGVIDAKTKEPFSDLTIYIDGYKLKENQAFIDPINKEVNLLEHLKTIGIISEIHDSVKHNWGTYTLASFDLEKLKEYDSVGFKRFNHQYENDFNNYDRNPIYYDRYVMSEMDFETKSGYFLHFHPSDNGYDFTYYDKDNVLIDGGILESEKFMKLKDVLEGITNLLSRPELDESLKDLLQVDGIKRTDEIIENIKI